MGQVIQLLPYSISIFDHLDKPTIHKVAYRHWKSEQTTCAYRVRKFVEGNIYIFNGEVWSPILTVLNNKTAKILNFKNKT